MKLTALFCLLSAFLHLGSQRSECAEPKLRLIDDPKDPFVFHHELTVNCFLDAEGFGARRVWDNVPGMHGTLTAHDGPWLHGESIYEVGWHDLVGLMKAPQPRVYPILEGIARAPEPKVYQEEMPSARYREAIAKRHAEVQTLPFPNGPFTLDGELPVRPLDAFESEALKLLREGHVLVICEYKDHVRMLGAIRAQETCLKCHDDKKSGDLLGAFTHFITKILASEKVKEERQAMEKQLASGGENDLWFRKEISRLDSLPIHVQFRRLLEHGFVTPTMIETLKRQRAQAPQVKAK